jgi:predicted nucleotidyltransferase
MGSQAYAVNSGNSDNDYYGFTMPPKEAIFPSQYGEIEGFGNPIPRFHQWQQAHVSSGEKGITHDFAIYNIAKYFHLCMECNPNMIDSLFTPPRCVVHKTAISQKVLDNRKLFLHKGAWHKFRGYAYSQIHKIENGVNRSNPSRQENIVKFGYDVKFAYHVVRLILEVEQILIEHDLDLERPKELLKSIRRGEWTLEHLLQWFREKEKSLENVYHTSTLQAFPNEDKIKTLLFECIEDFYGTIEFSPFRKTEAELVASIKKKLSSLQQAVARL